MGASSWSADAADNITRSMRSKPVDDIFTRNRTRTADKLMLPTRDMIRESRDSITHPESLAIAVFLDDTGSMGSIPEYMIKESFPTVMNTLIKHGIPHPQVMFSAIGDGYTDEYPVQVGQFESGADEISKGLANIYIERGGGGTTEEGYIFAHLIGARHVSMDCFEKRGIKGILFTIGDEKSHPKLTAERLQDVMGYPQSENLSHAQLIAECERQFHIYHIHAEEGTHRSTNHPEVVNYWYDLLGRERVILMDDKTTAAEIIAATVAAVNGADMNAVLKDFGSKAGTVSKALSLINTGSISKRRSEEGIVAL